MPRRAKIASIVTMWIGAAGSYLITYRAPLWVHALIVVISMTGTFEILYCLKTTSSNEPASTHRTEG